MRKYIMRLEKSSGLKTFLTIKAKNVAQAFQAVEEYKMNAQVVDFKTKSMYIICREVCRETGRVHVKLVGDAFDESINLTALSIRQRYNEEIKYYFIDDDFWDTGSSIIIDIMKKPNWKVLMPKGVILGLH